MGVAGLGRARIRCRPSPFPLLRSRPRPPDEIDSEIPLRPLGVSEILDAAVTYVRRNPRATLGMSAVLTAVIQVIITLAQYFALGTQAAQRPHAGRRRTHSAAWARS